MLWARCLAKGGNRIGQDLLMGLYVADEWLDTLKPQDLGKVQVTRDEDGHIKEVIDIEAEVVE